MMPLWDDYTRRSFWASILFALGMIILGVVIRSVSSVSSEVTTSTHQSTAPSGAFSCVREVDGLFLPCSEVWNNPNNKVKEEQNV